MAGTYRPSDEQLLEYGLVKEAENILEEIGHKMGWDDNPNLFFDGQKASNPMGLTSSSSHYYEFILKKPCNIWGVHPDGYNAKLNAKITNMDTEEIIPAFNPPSSKEQWYLFATIEKPGHYKIQQTSAVKICWHELFLQPISNIVIPDVENPEEVINIQQLLTASAAAKTYIDLNISNIITNEFSMENQYKSGDYVTFEKKLYRCVLNCAGIEPPNTTYWEETSVTDELNNSGGNADAVILTKSEYDALPNDKLTDNKQYFVTDWSQEGTSINVIDNLTSDSSTDALSAKQGKILNENKQDKNAPIHIVNDFFETTMDIGHNIELYKENTKEHFFLSPQGLSFGTKGDNGITILTSSISNDDTGILSVKISDIEGNVLSEKMNKENPTGTGSFSLNRKADTTVGAYSFAEGYNTTASGDYSHTEGSDTTASGTYSHAEGGLTEASGECSHAEGAWTVASGFFSHAEGVWTIAEGNCQHVFGKYNKTDGSKAFIVGNGTSETNRSNALELDWSGNLNIAGTLTGGVSSIAPQYDATVTYKINDYCYYDSKLYKCILQCTRTTPPNTTYWEEVTVMTAINNAILGAMGGSY